MNIQEIYKELNLSPEQLTELSETVKVNPMAAVGLIQKFNIKPEVLQKLMGLLLANPESLKDLARQAGVSPGLVDQVTQNLRDSKKES